MRTAFINELIKQARTIPELFLVVGDLGFSVIEPFAKEFPDRFLNVGVAEQNMTSVAAGLASEGFRVFTYSIANFPTLRCLEQIRNDICYHNLPVTITAVGGGMAYGNLGYSHHAVQDIAVMRTLPHMVIYSPADPGETRQCLQIALQKPGPSYFRLGKAGEADLHSEKDIGLGLILVREGKSDIAIVATGSVLKIALETAAINEKLNLSVYSCPIFSADSISSFDALWRYKKIITLEEHGLAGGFGSFLKEIAPASIKIQCCGVPPTTASLVGSQDYLRKQAGIDVQSLTSLILR